jgi:hypothetical protein
MTTLAPRKTRKESVIHLGKESIKQFDLTLTDDGFDFFVETEMEAYKAAYVYKSREVRVQFAEGAQRWMVSVSK